jgi:hypothetical protein
MSTGQNYRGFDIAQRVEIPCGAGFQPAQSPLRERLPFIYTDGIVHDYGLFRYYLYVTDYIISIVIRTLYFPVRLPGDIEFFLPYRQYILNKNNKNCRKQQIFNGFYCWYGICYPFFHGLEKTAPKGVLCDLIN